MQQNVFQNINEFLNLNKQERIFLFYSLFLLLTPLIITNQFLAGTIVNALLISAALRNEWKRIAILCTLPSIAVLASGLLFSNLTFFVIIMLPFIWIGNFIIAFFSRKIIIENKKNYFLGTFLSAIGKTIFLFTSVNILYYFTLVPALFINVFGLNQLITALSGAIIIGFIRIKK